MPQVKKNHVNAHYRVSPETKQTLSDLARQLGYEYGKGGAVGEMLEAIAKGEILLVPRRKPEKVSDRS